MSGPPGIRFKALENKRIDAARFGDNAQMIIDWQEFEIDVPDGESLQYLTLPQFNSNNLLVKFEEKADPFPGDFFATASLGQGVDRCGGYIGDNPGPCKVKIWIGNHTFCPVYSLCAVAFITKSALHEQQLPRPQLTNSRGEPV